MVTPSTEHDRARRVAARVALLLAGVVPLGCAGPAYRAEAELYGDQYAMGVPVRYAIVDHDGDTPVKMAYIEMRPLGRAPLTLVLVHGLTSGRELWRPLMARLPGRWRTIAPDLVGYGMSSKPGWAGVPWGEAYDVWQHALHVSRLALATVSRGPIVLVGHGFGAKVVLAAYMRDAALRKRCRALVLVNPDPLLSAGDPWADVPAYERACADPIANFCLCVGVNQLLELDADAARRVLERSFHDRALISREMVDQAVAGVRRPGALGARYRTAWNRVFRDHARFQAEACAADVPVLILHGKDDRLVSPASAMRYHRCLKRSVLVGFGRAGHDLVREQPEQVAAAMTRVLGPVSATRPTTRPTPAASQPAPAQARP